jgi:nitrite reductase/ring-hydroxylating ferredoxin subunit
MSDGTPDESEKIVVGRADELADNRRLIVDVDGREIGVFRLDGEYYACLNYCPHQSGPLCEGEITKTLDATFDRKTLELTQDWIKEDRIIACPWHGWEFDVTSGECVSRPNVALPTYDVEVSDGDVLLVMK